MNVNVWGPGAWTFLHSITFNYPDTPTDMDKQVTRDFFHSLKYVLPCSWCRSHYRDAIEKELPIEPNLGNQDRLSRWLVALHNSVNVRLGKPVLTYEAVKEKYDSMKGMCSGLVGSASSPSCEEVCSTTAVKATQKQSVLLYIIIGLLVLLLVVLGAHYLCRKKHGSSNYFFKNLDV